jgi:hypothetical protein
MIAKFETQQGYKAFDELDNVEWIFDGIRDAGPEVNLVALAKNPLDTTNFQLIHGVTGPDHMPKEEPQTGSEAKEHEWMISVDEKFYQRDVCQRFRRPLLVYAFTRTEKLKIFFTDGPVYLLNDNGKTIERL